MPLLLLLLLLQLEIFGVLVKTLGLYQVPKLRKPNTTTTTIAAAATTHSEILSHFFLTDDGRRTTDGRTDGVTYTIRWSRIKMTESLIFQKKISQARIADAP